MKIEDLKRRLTFELIAERLEGVKRLEDIASDQIHNLAIVVLKEEETEVLKMQDVIFEFLNSIPNFLMTRNSETEKGKLASSILIECLDILNETLDSEDEEIEGFTTEDYMKAAEYILDVMTEQGLDKGNIPLVADKIYNVLDDIPQFDFELDADRDTLVDEILKEYIKLVGS